MFNSFPFYKPIQQSNTYEDFESTLQRLSTSCPWLDNSYNTTQPIWGAQNMITPWFNPQQAIFPWFNNFSNYNLPYPGLTLERSSETSETSSTEKTGEKYDPKTSFRPYDYNKYGKNGNYIKELCPVMQEKVIALLDYAKKEGINLQIISGYRSYEEQKQLYEDYRRRGLTKRAAKPGTSPHEFGRAIDINRKILKNGEIQKLAKYAKETLHMRWGGDFKNWDTEQWHFDISPEQAGQVRGQRYTPTDNTSQSNSSAQTNTTTQTTKGSTPTSAYDAILS